MKIHPAADVFPMMEGKLFDSFVDDIKSIGLIDPIKTLGGVIIDGRNRYAACSIAGVTPRYEEVTTDDPVAYVISTNINRRHLTTKQRVAIAAELANMEHGGDRIQTHPSSKNTTCSDISEQGAADLMGVSKSSVTKAKKTMKENPAAHEAAKRGNKVKPKKKKKKTERSGWQNVALSYGLMSGTSGGGRESLKKKLIIINGDIDFNAPFVGENLVRVTAACETLAKEKGLETPAPLEMTTPQVKRRDLEIEMIVQIRVTERLQDMLVGYRESVYRHNRVVRAYKGVFTDKEYKLLVGLLHASNMPELSDSQANRFDKGFNLLQEKKLELCGLPESVVLSNTMPANVAEMVARRACK